MKITDDARQNRASIAPYRMALQRLGLALPATPEPEYSLPTFATKTDVTTAALEAIRAGKDPTTDKNVQKLITGWQIGQAGLADASDLDQSKNELRHAQDHAQQIIPELTERFTLAVETMREAMPTIGHVDLSQGMTFTPGMGAGKAVVMAQAAEANHTATTITQSWRTILDAAGDRTMNPKDGRLALMWAHPSLEQWNNHQLSAGMRTNKYGRATNVWDALHDDITVELVTSVTEWEERVEELEQAQMRAEAEAERRRQDEKPRAW